MTTARVDINTIENAINKRRRDPILDGPETMDRDEAPPSPAPERSNTGPTVNANLKFRIPGDLIARTCENLPDDQRHALKWAAGYCRARNISHEEFGALLRQPGKDEPYSGDSVYAAFTGRRAEGSGSLERISTAIHVLRKRVEETSARGTVRFVETALSKKIFAACRQAFEKKRVTFILGETQIGKSRTLEEYARLHNHGETIMVRMPTGGSLREFMSELAIRLGISPQAKRAELRRRLIESFDDRTCLIVDECEQSLESHNGLAALEFAREIYDRRKCGLVLCGALNFRDALQTNYTLRKLWLRGIRPLTLPSRPSRADLDKFTEAFGLGPAEDKDISIYLDQEDADGNSSKKKITRNPLQLQTNTIRDFGLGRWLAILEDAQDLAKESETHITWGRLIAAYVTFQENHS